MVLKDRSVSSLLAIDFKVLSPSSKIFGEKSLGLNKFLLSSACHHIKESIGGYAILIIQGIYVELLAHRDVSE